MILIKPILPERKTIMNCKQIIESLMELKGLNQSAMAKKSKTTRQAFNVVMNSKFGPRIDTMTKILDNLDYKLVAAPKGVVLPPFTYTFTDDNSTPTGRYKKVCGDCNKTIKKDEYCQPYKNKLLCQDCINKRFADMIEIQES